MIGLFTCGVGNDQTMCDYLKRKGKVKPTHVMTSFKDSIAFSSVILSGLSSDVCFFMSALEEERKGLVKSRQAG